MEKNWPFFNSTMDMLDMVISKVDPDISEVYEDGLADSKLKNVGKKLRLEFDNVQKLNKYVYHKKKHMTHTKTEQKTQIIPRAKMFFDGGGIGPR